MNWLKKIFQDKPIETKITLEKETELAYINEDQFELIISLSDKDMFVGIDKDFINLFYFKNEDEKSNYSEQIIKIASNLNIKVGMDYFSAHKILTEYNYSSENEFIPFLIDSLLFKSILNPKTESYNRSNADNKLIINNGFGEQKLKTYYSALNFCSVNLLRKTENNYFDFQYEENLITQTLEKSDLFNFARIDTLFNLGQAYLKADNLKMMDNAFERIKSVSFHLAESTISNYYRSIGEIYIKLNDNNKALDWLKSGLKINPKLGVKKLVDQIEKQNI